MCAVWDGEWRHKAKTVKKVHHYFGVNCPKNSANEIWGSQSRKLCIVSQYEILGVINPKFVGYYRYGMKKKISLSRDFNTRCFDS
ncbi:Uncharacterized protein APZ42_029192 [Daphnia magna]|uniref:Uncharacterized protein n=1 Tax=Daphnia magna TaxID=35525 RepID=A0A162D5E6_9CRUS|nr:Uncharacterized protein APZ42_029192 [Daphnia magna]